MRFTRRKLILSSAAVIAGAAAIDALAIEPGWLDTALIQHPVEGLSAGLEGLTIAQITDAHLTELGRVEERILDVVREQAPQVVVLTGDLIDDVADAGTLAELCAELRNTGATIVATLGNWEHWGRVDRSTLERTYRKTDTHLLVDRWVRVEGLSLYGSDDSTAGAPHRLIPADHPDDPRVLLTHSPAFVDRPHPSIEFDVVLSGHTHGGQLTVGGVAPITPPGSGRYVAGWYDTPLGPMYVSRGTGTSVVPARFMCRPELPMIELVRA